MERRKHSQVIKTEESAKKQAIKFGTMGVFEDFEPVFLNCVSLYHTPSAVAKIFIKVSNDNESVEVEND